MALVHRHRAGHGRCRGGPAARAARGTGHAPGVPGARPAAPGRLERDRRSDPARRRRGHAGRGAGADHGRAGPGRPDHPQPLQARLRPAETGLRGDRHPPGGHRAHAGHPGRTGCGHRGLAALPGSLPAGRGPGARRGPVHGGGAAGRGRAVDAGLLTGRARGVRRGGRPADDHRPPRSGRRGRGPVHPPVPADRLSGRRGGAHRTGRLSLHARAVPLPLPGDLAARGALRAPLLGVPAADGGRADDGRLDGGLHLSGGVHARRALGADDGGPDAGAGAVPGRRRGDPARAHRRAPALHAADAGPAGDTGHERRRPLCAHRRRPPGRRRLVRHDPAAGRAVRPGHRGRPGP